MKVIGYYTKEFTLENGNVIRGINLIYGNLIDSQRGEGIFPDKPLFLTHRKLEQLDYFPAVGDQIDIVFNREGKVQKITRMN